MHARMALTIFVFLIGSALHTMAQVDAIARSKNNPAKSRIGILADRWQTIVIRAAWSLAIFALWLQGQLVAFLSALNITLPDMASRILDLHIGAPVSFMAGYVFDSALAFIPGLKSSVPPAIDSYFVDPPADTKKEG